jgi:hypothetical protein
MLKRRIFCALAIVAGAGLVGCATTRSELELPAPAAAPAAPAAAQPALAGGKVAVIRSVRDERVFEDAPADPSKPSLGFGGASKAPADIKARAFGRKRGGFGQAFGDLLLQPGQTVETVVRDNLGLALRQAGLQLLADPAAAPPDALLIDVRVKAFWSWINPGFWALAANGRIVTELDIAGRAGTIRVAVEHNESRQLMTEGAWLEVMTTTLRAWQAEAAKQVGAVAAAR